MRTWLVACLVLLPAAPAAAQWAVAPEFGVVGFGVAARDSDGTNVGAERANVIGLRVTVGNLHRAVGLRVRHGSGGLRLSGHGLSVVQEDVFDFTELSAFAAVRVFRIGESSMQVEAGPTLTIWNPNGESSRSRAGGAIDLAWVLPAGRTLAAAVRVETSVSGSVFDQADLPSSATRRATWRQGMFFEVRRTF
jgi:hypothetical protein